MASPEDARKGARQLLSDPQSVRVLDTETTGLCSAAEVVSLAIIDGEGRTLYHAPRIRPSSAALAAWTPQAQQVSGIGPDDVALSPWWAEVAPDVMHHLSGRRVVGHFVEFDRRMIRQSNAGAGLLESLQLPPPRGWHCTKALAQMLWPGQPAGLDACCPRIGIPAQTGTHGALDDARRCLSLLRWAAGLPPLYAPAPDPYQMPRHAVFAQRPPLDVIDGGRASGRRGRG